LMFTWNCSILSIYILSARSSIKPLTSPATCSANSFVFFTVRYISLFSAVSSFSSKRNSGPNTSASKSADCLSSCFSSIFVASASNLEQSKSYSLSMTLASIIMRGRSLIMTV
jgi:hypothetical protein